MPEPVPSSVRRGYALGSVATGTFGTVPGLLLLPYLTDSLGVTAAVAGIIVVVPKLWDVVLDPVAGRMSDRSRHPAGRRRPFMLRGGLLLALFFALMFAGPVSPVAGAAWVVVTFLLCATAYGFFQVPYVAMPAEMTDGYAERTRLLTWRVVVLALAILLSGATAPLVVNAFGGGPSPEGYRLMGVYVAVIIAAGVLGAWWGTRDAPTIEVGPATGSLREQMRLVAAEPDFRALLLTFVIQALGIGAMLAGVAYVANQLFDSPAAATFLFAAFVGPALLVTPVWERAFARRGKKAGYVVSTLFLVVGALALFAARDALAVLVYPAAALVGIGYAGAQVFPMAMLPDAAARDAERSGENRIGVFTGVWTAGETLGLALGPGLFALILAVGGYVSSGPDADVTQPDSALTAIAVGFSIVPAVLIALSLLALRHYRLDWGLLPRAQRVGGGGPTMTEGQGPGGRDLQGVLARLEGLRADDLPTHGGRTLAYVYDSGVAEADELGRSALAMYGGTNGLDPTAFPSLLRMENDLVVFARELFHGGPDVVGTATSGGTESIILAVKAARDARPDVADPVMVLPTTIHAAFHKAAHYLGVRAVTVDVDPRTFRADVKATAAALEEHGDDVVLVAASAPSYAHGVVDPIAELAEQAHRRSLRMHVDACIGGWVLPWVEGTAPWDFAVEGVTSISADLHKYAYAPKGVSLLLHADAGLRQSQFFASADWPGYTMLNSTVQSTKSGGPLAAAWAVVQYFGADGYADLVRTTIEGTRRLAAGIDDVDHLHVVAPPDSSLVAIGADDSRDIFTISDAMLDRGWFVQPQMGFRGGPATLHVSLSAATAASVPDFLVALSESVAEAVAAGPIVVDPNLRAAAESIDPTTLDDATFDGLLQVAGLAGDGGAVAVPDRMAPVNALLDVARPALREALLVAFLDRLTRP